MPMPYRASSARQKPGTKAASRIRWCRSKDINGLTILAKDEHMRPTTTMQSLGQLQPSFVAMGQMGGFDAVAIQAHPEVERINYVHHAGNSSGIVDGRRCGAARQQGSRRKIWE